MLINDIDGDIAEQAAGEIDGDTAVFAGDITKPGAPDDLVKKASDDFGHVDLVVNNAGYTHKNQPMLEVDEEEFDRIYAVNVKAIYLAALAAVPELEKRGGGVIINTASTAGLRPRPGLTWYNSSKGAAITMTKSMAAELAPKVRMLPTAVGDIVALEGRR